MNSTRGSPLYMAPEIVLHEEYDIKADLWSVGVIAYECIYGCTPYISDSLYSLHEIFQEKTPIEIPINEVGPECRDLIMNLLKHDPSERINYSQFFKHPFCQPSKY